MINHPPKPEDDQRKENISGFFTRAASSYDHVGPRFFSYYGQRLVELAQLAPSSRVLDVASGRGAVLMAAAAAVGASGYVTGIDLTPAMVQETAQELSLQGLAWADIQVMDAENLQFTDGTFDALLCGFGIFFFPKPLRAMAEFRRVLKPGGRLAYSTWDQSFKQHWDWYDQLFAQHLPSPTKEPQPVGPTPLRLPDFGTPEGLRSFTAQAGFTDIQVQLETPDFIYTDTEQFWASLWSHGTRSALERLEKAKGPEGLERFKADVMAILKSRQQVDGIHQKMPARITIAKKP